MRRTPVASAPSAIAYAVGWTQHTVGVQLIRTAAIIQLLLGNIGRPGGGILALRGHASIQGSTDIPTLYNILPGYLTMPHTEDYGGLDAYVEATTAPGGFWGNADAYIVSLLKAWWGSAATSENDFCFDYLPRIDDDNSHYWTVQQMLQGKVSGYIVAGENPAVGSANGKAQRLGLAQLDWLVVRDLVEIETAAFWYDSPEIESGELTTGGDRDRGVLHARRDSRREGRLVHEHAAAPAVALQGRRAEGGLPVGALVLLPPRQEDPREARGLDRARRTSRSCDLTWGYPTQGQIEEPSAEAVLAEINGWDGNGQALASYTDLKADGSTACGCWIYCGVFAGGRNLAARRKPHWEQSYTALEWGWAWPANRRVIYNRASAAPDGSPWSERKRYVWWDAEKREVDGRRHARLRGGQIAGLRALRRRERARRDPRRRSVHHAGRRSRLALRAPGPERRPAADPLRAAGVARP